MHDRLSKLAASSLVVLITACAGSSNSPTQADPPPIPPPSLSSEASASSWTATENWESYRGPDNCMARELEPLPGPSYDLPVEIETNGEAISLWFELDVELGLLYSGNLNGREFVASGSSLFQRWRCDNGTFVDIEPLSDVLVGTFSEDGTRFSAVETLTGRLAPGVTFVIEKRMQGVRRTTEP